MSVDEITKLVYAFGITGSVIGVSIFLIRFLDRLTKRIEELEKTTENAGEISEQLAENMQLFSDIAKKLKYDVVDPLTEVFALVKFVKGIIPGMGGEESRGRDQEEMDVENEKD